VRYAVTVTCSLLAAGSSWMTAPELSCSDFSSNPGAATRTSQGTAHATVSLPSPSLRPSNFPEESFAVAPANTASLSSSTVTVIEVAFCALDLIGANTPPASASTPTIALDRNHRMGLAFAILVETIQQL
jgi:hypothetical protein